MKNGTQKFLLKFFWLKNFCAEAPQTMRQSKGTFVLEA
jgi:hypothetical protein